MATTHAADAATVQATLDELDAAIKVRDTGRIVACFAEDATLQVVQGTYRGKAAITRFFDWNWEILRSIEYHDTGRGLQVYGAVAVYEGTMRGVSYDGASFETPTLAVYEFNDAGKITRTVQMFNQWSLVRQSAPQATGLFGPVFRWFVGRTDDAMSKGLPVPS
jgi:ketosteroid isomerase-like protein